MATTNSHREIELQRNSNTVFVNWTWIVIFSMAFAWVESAVVVYLRDIYFDGNFSFPLTVKWVDGKHVVDPLVRIEFGREIATMIILIAVGWISGKNRFQKFCFFMIAFGVWDIFYYVWLFVMVGWPESLLTWDLLFYVPLPWVGPVISPLLIAITMVVAGSLILYFDQKGYEMRWRWYDMGIELMCALVMIVAFCWDWKNILQIPGDIQRSGFPNPFAWWLYLPAYCFSITYLILRLRQWITAKPLANPQS